MLHFNRLERLIICVNLGHQYLITPDLIPQDLLSLEYETSSAYTPLILAILADSKVAPMLRTVPRIRIAGETARSTGSLAQLKPSVTKIMVEKAIEGLAKRGTIENVYENAVKLYELVTE